MEFFENGFLNNLPDRVFNLSGAAVTNLVIFAIVVIVALEISRRITRFGTPLAMLMIAAAALYTTGATAWLLS